MRPDNHDEMVMADDGCPHHPEAAELDEGIAKLLADTRLHDANESLAHREAVKNGESCPIPEYPEDESFRGEDHFTGLGDPDEYLTWEEAESGPAVDEDSYDPSNEIDQGRWDDDPNVYDGTYSEE